MALPSVAFEQPRRSATILPFPKGGRGGQAANRLSQRDRIEAQRWADRADKARFSRVDIHEVRDTANPEIGDFVLIYRPGASWAAWGIGVNGNTYTLWRPANGATMGLYPSMQAALAALASIPLPVR